MKQRLFCLLLCVAASVLIVPVLVYTDPYP